ncbi:MAG: PilZ domain-containing protein [Deltaproteobacteria bacterium]|nr:PilZ domain-containing protein [Deltaproteobacteria bacterium]
MVGANGADGKTGGWNHTIMTSGKTGDKSGAPDYVAFRGDRRRNLRGQIIVLKVKGEDARGAFFGYAKTIGAGGMFITSVNPRNVGEEFTLSFTVTEADITVRCRAVVVWCQEFDPMRKQEPGMGIRFLDIAEETRAAITEWAGRLDRK